MAGVGKRHLRQARGLPLAVVSTVAVAAAPLLTSAVQAHPSAGPAAPEVGASSQVLSLGPSAAQALGFPEGLVGAELRLGSQPPRSGIGSHATPPAAASPPVQESAGFFSPGVYRMGAPSGTYHPFQSGLTIHITPGYYYPGSGPLYGRVCTAGTFHDTVTSQQQVTTSTGEIVTIHTVTYVTVSSSSPYPAPECHRPEWYSPPSAGAPPYQGPLPSGPPVYQPPPSQDLAPQTPPQSAPPGQDPPPATTDPNGAPPYRPGWPQQAPGTQAPSMVSPAPRPTAPLPSPTGTLATPVPGSP